MPADACKVASVVLCEIVNQMVNIVDAVIDRRGGEEIEFLTSGKFHQKPTTVGTRIPKVVCFVYNNNVLVFLKVFEIVIAYPTLTTQVGMQFNIVVFAEQTPIFWLELATHLTVPDALCN